MVPCAFNSLCFLFERAKRLVAVVRWASPGRARWLGEEISRRLLTVPLLPQSVYQERVVLRVNNTSGRVPLGGMGALAASAASAAVRVRVGVGARCLKLLRWSCLVLPWFRGFIMIALLRFGRSRWALGCS